MQTGYAPGSGKWLNAILSHDVSSIITGTNLRPAHQLLLEVVAPSIIAATIISGHLKLDSLAIKRR